MANEAVVTVGTGAISIRRVGSTKQTVANIIGSINLNGVEHIYLDRLIHAIYEDTLGEFTVSGAISSILSRPSIQ